MLKYISAICLCLQWPIQPALADTTGNRLFSDCDTQDHDYSATWGLCYGYIEGVFDALEDVMPMCGYAGVTARQLHDIVYQYLESHPAERQLDAHYLVARAFKQAFPCK